MPAPYITGWPELQQIEEHFHRLSEQSMVTATSTGRITAEEQIQRIRAVEERVRQMTEMYHPPRFVIHQVHDELVYHTPPAARTPKTIADNYAIARAMHKSNFTKFEERVNEIRSGAVRRKKLNVYSAKTTRSFSSW